MYHPIAWLSSTKLFINIKLFGIEFNKTHLCSKLRCHLVLKMASINLNGLFRCAIPVDLSRSTPSLMSSINLNGFSSPFEINYSACLSLEASELNNFKERSFSCFWEDVQHELSFLFITSTVAWITYHSCIKTIFRTKTCWHIVRFRRHGEFLVYVLPWIKLGTPIEKCFHWLNWK